MRIRWEGDDDDDDDFAGNELSWILVFKIEREREVEKQKEWMSLTPFYILLFLIHIIPPKRTTIIRDLRTINQSKSKWLFDVLNIDSHPLVHHSLTRSYLHTNERITNNPWKWENSMFSECSIVFVFAFWPYFKSFFSFISLYQDFYLIDIS